MNANRFSGMHEISVAMVHRSNYAMVSYAIPGKMLQLRVDLQRGERSEAKKQILTVAEQVDVRSAKRATVRSVRLLWSTEEAVGRLPDNTCQFIRDLSCLANASIS